MCLQTGTTTHVDAPDGQNDSFSVTAGVLLGDTLAADWLYHALGGAESRWRVRLPVVPPPVTTSPCQVLNRPVLRWRHRPTIWYHDGCTASAFCSGTLCSLSLSVGLHINQRKTLCILISDVKDATAALSTHEGPIQIVEDFKYLGSWTRSSQYDFEVRRAMAFIVADILWRV